MAHWRDEQPVDPLEKKMHEEATGPESPEFGFEPAGTSTDTRPPEEYFALQRADGSVINPDNIVEGLEQEFVDWDPAMKSTILMDIEDDGGRYTAECIADMAECPLESAKAFVRAYGEDIANIVEDGADL